MKSNYIKIYDWQLDLGLNRSELLVLSVIYGFTETKGQYDGSQSYIRKRTHLSKCTVQRALDSLVNYGYIEKLENEISFHGGKYFPYKAIANEDTQPCDKLSLGSKMRPGIKMRPSTKMSHSPVSKCDQAQYQNDTKPGIKMSHDKETDYKSYEKDDKKDSINQSFFRSLSFPGHKIKDTDYDLYVSKVHDLMFEKNISTEQACKSLNNAIDRYIDDLKRNDKYPQYCKSLEKLLTVDYDFILNRLEVTKHNDTSQFGLSLVPNEVIWTFSDSSAEFENMILNLMDDFRSMSHDTGINPFDADLDTYKSIYQYGIDTFGDWYNIVDNLQQYKQSLRKHDMANKMEFGYFLYKGWSECRNLFNDRQQ